LELEWASAATRFATDAHSPAVLFIMNGIVSTFIGTSPNATRVSGRLRAITLGFGVPDEGGHAGIGHGVGKGLPAKTYREVACLVCAIQDNQHDGVVVRVLEGHTLQAVDRGSGRNAVGTGSHKAAGMGQRVVVKITGHLAGPGVDGDHAPAVVAATPVRPMRFVQSDIP